MALTLGEKVGAILAFIPGVSTITSGIKAYIYYNRYKNGSSDIRRMQATADKTARVAKTQLLNNGNAVSTCKDKLWKASLLEMIPGYNIIAAIRSLGLLHELSELRELQENPELQAGPLLERYKDDLSNIDQGRERFTEGLRILQDISAPDEKTLYHSWADVFELRVVRGFIKRLKDSDQTARDALKDVIEGALKTEVVIIKELEADKADSEKKAREEQPHLAREFLRLANCNQIQIDQSQERTRKLQYALEHIDSVPT